MVHFPPFSCRSLHPCPHALLSAADSESHFLENVQKIRWVLPVMVSFLRAFFFLFFFFLGWPFSLNLLSTLSSCLICPAPIIPAPFSSVPDDSSCDKCALPRPVPYRRASTINWLTCILSDVSPSVQLITHPSLDSALSRVPVVALLVLGQWAVPPTVDASFLRHHPHPEVGTTLWFLPPSDSPFNASSWFLFHLAFRCGDTQALLLGLLFSLVLEFLTQGAQIP